MEINTLENIKDGVFEVMDKDYTYANGDKYVGEFKNDAT